MKVTMFAQSPPSAARDASRCTAPASHSPRTRAAFGLALAALTATFLVHAPAQAEPPPLQALPTLQVDPYMGTWYQVAWFPNRFQRQCVSDTTATYRLLPEGRVEVVNRCRRADGREDSVTGVARPAGSTLRDGVLAPAQLEVSFLPAALRWLPFWGRYWVIQRADDGRYAVVSEHSRKYLWVLSRTPTLSDADETAIRSQLTAQGFVDLSAWERHPHPNASQAQAATPTALPEPTATTP
jgi:apolipoprotein D and lipocalin family protein